MTSRFLLPYNLLTGSQMEFEHWLGITSQMWTREEIENFEQERKRYNTETVTSSEADTHYPLRGNLNPVIPTLEMPYEVLTGPEEIFNAAIKNASESQQETVQSMRKNLLPKMSKKRCLKNKIEPKSKKTKSTNDDEENSFYITYSSLTGSERNLRKFLNDQNTSRTMKNNLLNIRKNFLKK